MSNRPDSFSKGFAPAANKQPDEIHQLWTSTIDPLLQDKISSAQQAYDDGHLLMVPLHAAFLQHDLAWERGFSGHFQQLVSDPSVLPSIVLSRLQYLYLASQFAVLAKQNGSVTLIPPALPDLLFAEIRSHWQDEPAVSYDHPVFRGMRERLLYKLNKRRVAKSYYRAVLDEELFLFAIAADLQTYQTYSGTGGQPREWTPTLNDILKLAHRVFSQEVVFQPGGGWLFEPGVWTDHPDYKYAGNTEARAGIQPALAPNAAWDSSHSLRFPLWLTSLMAAYPIDSASHRFYAGLREGLAKQFFDKVLVRPSGENPCYLTTNYMDGSNGVYRWNYMGPGVGYGPYGVSVALMLGWWSFLDSDRTRTLYHDIAKAFPWPRQCVEIYLGPTPSGRQSDTQVAPDSSAMRLWHVLALLASEVR